MSQDYRRESFWLESSGDDLAPRPSLQGRTSADIAIVGAGFTGLWTAYYLLSARPNSRIVLLDSRIAGFGASGRNGGGCSGRLGNQSKVSARWSPDQRDRMSQAQAATLHEIQRVIGEHHIECDFLRSGSLSIATGPEQLPALRSAQQGLGHGIGTVSRVALDEEELRQRIHVAGALGAVFEREAAVLHPGKLVRALARLVESMGATIYEETEVVSWEGGEHPTVTSRGGGSVQARDLVISCESYLSQFPAYRQALVPITSSIVLTEPLAESDWQDIGWEGRELLTDFRLSVLYMQRTADGRILIGGRGAPYRFGSSLSEDHNGSAQMYAALRATGARLFPALKKARFTHAWSGSLGAPRDYHPSIRYLAAQHVAVLGGYTGTGVGPSNLFGRTAADLLSGNSSPLTKLPLVGWSWRKWEPEPFRWAGIRYVQRRLLSLDAKARRTGRAPSGRSLAERWRPR